MGSKRISSLLVVAFCVCVAQSAERIIYVDGGAGGANDGSSWTDAYTHLQDALAAAATESETTEIRVAQGVYLADEGINQASVEDITFRVPSGVRLRGGYAGAGSSQRDVALYPTVLESGTLDTSPPPRPFSNFVVTANQTGPGTLVEGFVVTGISGGMLIDDARLDITDCTFQGNFYSGMTLEVGSDVTASHCQFVNNRGGGIRTRRSRCILTDCLFESNEGGSVLDSSTSRGGADPLMGEIVAVDCIFRASQGEAISASSPVDLLRCSFVDTVGGLRGAIHCSGSLAARQCRFVSNTATLTSAISAHGDVTLTDCEFIGNVSERDVVEAGSEGVTTVTGCSFVGNWTEPGGRSILNSQSLITRISQCLFSGNTIGRLNDGAIGGLGQDLHVSNCTFAGNRGAVNVVDGHWHTVAMTQCIVSDEVNLFGDVLSPGGHLEVTYNSIPGGYPGLDNIDVDPAFVREGYWADPDDSTVELGPDDAEAVWVPGEYHLQSQAGHWDSASEAWALDDTTSPCIDAGDPNGYLGNERFPNGGYVNLGAYGGTTEASRSYFGKPVCTNQLAGDINGDCIVDETDVYILLSHWLMDATQRVNVPPTVSIITPTDGAVWTGSGPFELRAEASDSDGVVVKVRYDLYSFTDHRSLSIGVGGSDSSDDWARQVRLPSAAYDEEITIIATATDNEGASTTSAPITVTQRPED